MPRRKISVKDNSSNRPRRPVSKRIRTAGIVDIHFHGAFGIDLMTAAAPAMDELSERLWQGCVSAFCPTTLSSTPAELEPAIQRIGAWTRAQWAKRLETAKRSGTAKHSGTAPRAIPLGIHLEGPFINPASRGAHPENAIRPIQLSELERLWELSQKTLKILTVAPEEVADLKSLSRWCRARKIILSLGHSRATEDEAREAFDAGFSGLTHAWNAMPFHHRAPGPLGAALGRKDVHVELIIDQIHVAPAVLRWTQKLHGNEPLCYVSDCAPAAGTAASESVAGPWARFGSLEIREEGGACRLKDGSLAGGGRLLPEIIARLILSEARFSGARPEVLLKHHCRHWSSDPLRALRLPADLHQRAFSGGSVEWRVNQSQLIAER